MNKIKKSDMPCDEFINLVRDVKFTYMGKEKYYTPSIEEFYSGFEYELLGHSGRMVPGGITQKWETLEYSLDASYLNDEDSLKELLDCGEIRVKYLDSSDIEELGFKLAFSDIGIECWKLGNFELRTDVDLGAYIDSGNLYSIFYNPYGKQYNCVFSGIIKNKSELKKVLNMLNIK